MVLAAAVAGAIAVVSVAASGAAGACLPPVGGCPPPPPPPSAPRIASVAATAVADTSVVLSATVNPGGQATSYDWYVYSSYNGPGQVASGTLAPSSSDQPIQQRVTALLPDTDHRFELMATSQDGSVYAYGTFKTTTNLRISLSIRDPEIAIGTFNRRMKLKIRLRGDLGPQASVLLSVATPPYRAGQGSRSTGRAGSRPSSRAATAAAPCTETRACECRSALSSRARRASGSIRPSTANIARCARGVFTSRCVRVLSTVAAA